ncbi:uncharacterized protein LOC135377205 [Ornithodoros turicata]|uniref:uncharacterized protein LOC135367459 n=1 Tax=Ornithodoros turicata TaxID=34597 RepID=UPI0031389B14
MPGINWRELDAATMAGLSPLLIRDELSRRDLDTTGSDAELVQRLQACLDAERSTASTTRETLQDIPQAPVPFDPRILQQLTASINTLTHILQQAQQPPQSLPMTMSVPSEIATSTLPMSPPLCETMLHSSNTSQASTADHGVSAIPSPHPQTAPQSALHPVLQPYQMSYVPQINVTTMPDISSSIPAFEDGKKQKARLWIEDLQRTQQLASWSPDTTRLIAASKLRGTAKNWHLTSGREYPTWDSWKTAFLDTFAQETSLIQWQQQVMATVQHSSQSLRDYAYGKLRAINKCPAPPTDAQKVEYLLQGISTQSTATSIAAQRPASVAAFLEMCNDIDRTLQHLQQPTSVPPRHSQEEYKRHQSRPSASLGPPNTGPPKHQLASPNTANLKSYPEGPPRPHALQQRVRIADLAPEQKEVRYEALSQRYGAPAFRPGDPLSEAVCFSCREKGHLSSKCPTKQGRQNHGSSSSKTATQTTAIPAPPVPHALHTTTSETFDGSQLECSFFRATIASIGPCDAFPDSGSKMTIIHQSLVTSTQLLPWTQPPLGVVGGSTVLPEGTICLKITIGPISGVVEAVVLHNNVLPLILGEDWFRVTGTRLVFEPPNPAEVHHPASGSVVQAHLKLYPRSSCAVVLHQSSLAQGTAPEAQPTLGLQESSLPDTKPPWEPLCKSTAPSHCTRSAPDETVTIPVHDDLPPAAVGKELSQAQQSELASVLSTHHSVFARNEDDIGHLKGLEHHIELLPNAVPYSRSPYRYSPDDRRFLDEQTDKLLKQGILLPATGPWAFPAIVVTRGQKKRLCVNYIPLNKLTITAVHPLPHADDIIHDVAGASYFACLDLKFAYWQVSLRPEDYAKTAFITHSGTYMWTRMPFGLKNAPSTFQRAMQLVFSNFKAPQKSGIRIYLDDILVFASSFPDFVEVLQLVLHRLEHHGLKVSLDKCRYGLSRIRFLGFILCSDGKLPDPTKVTAMLNIPRPTTRKQVLSWVQTANFYRRFIKNFSRIATPLYALVKAPEWYWNTTCEQAFQTVRKALTEAPLLGHFLEEVPTTVTTDASASAVGAVLTQLQNGHDTVIEYASRKLTPDEQKLHSNVWECIAVHWAITLRFRHYLLGRKFPLITDNWTVVCLTTNVRPSRRFTGMLMDLIEFDFSVEHRPGRQNVVADHLSRLSLAITAHNSSLAELQREDPQCAAARLTMQDNPSCSDFLDIDGILYKQSDSGHPTLVVPAKMRSAILHTMHDCAGHMGSERTLRKLHDRYWWPGLTASVQNYVTSCQTCQLYNRPTSKNVGFMGHMPVSEIPFSIIAFDHIMMPPTGSARYIFNVIDFTTRFIIPAAVRSTNTADVIAHLHSIFYRFGAPDHCLSDHGAAFESAQFVRFMRLHGVQVHYSTAYRAEGNGMIERSNGSLVTVLWKISPQNQPPWDSKLAEAAFAVNTAYNASTGFSPFELLFGYLPKLPEERHRPPSASSLAERLLDVQTARVEALTNSETAQHRRKKLYDRTHRQHSFQVGDFVWIRRQQPVLQGLEKLSPRFKGVYRLTEQLTPSTFQAMPVTGQSIRQTKQPRTVHVSQLKKYVPPLSAQIDEDRLSSQPASDLTDTSDYSASLPVTQVNSASQPTTEQPSQRPNRQRKPPSYLSDYELEL